LHDFGADLNALTQVTRSTRLVSISVAGQTALHIAAERKPQALESALFLIEKGINTNITDSKGNRANFMLPKNNKD